MTGIKRIIGRHFNRHTLYVASLTILVVLSVFATKPVNNQSHKENIVQYAYIPEFSINGLQKSDLHNKSAPPIMAVNFFASWCTPCQAEHPALTKLSQQIPLYGISFMDDPDKTDKFLNRLGDIYIKRGDDINGIAGDKWSVTGLPVTFVINNKGQILYRHDGPLTQTDIDNKIQPLL